MNVMGSTGSRVMPKEIKIFLVITLCFFEAEGCNCSFVSIWEFQLPQVYFKTRLEIGHSRSCTLFPSNCYLTLL